MQLLQENFAHRVEMIMNELCMDTQLIQFEVTETVYARSFDLINNQLYKISNLGIKIALDDFGTGYSSLTYLRKLPISTLKIDKSFIDDIIEDKEARLLSSVIIEMGHTLNLKIVAEGVENEEQLSYLKKYNCHAFQGYLYRPPLSEEDAINILKE